MNITIEEMFMIIGDREVQLYQERKEKQILQQRINGLERALNEVNSELTKIRVGFNTEGSESNRVVDFTSKDERSRGTNNELPQTATGPDGL